MESSEAPRGAVHVDLLGAEATFRYRPTRLAADALGAALTCDATIDGARVPELAVLDVSATGMAIAPPPGVFLAPGAVVDDVALRYRDAIVWRGVASVVYQVEGPPARLGLRVTSDLLPVEKITVRDRIAGRSLAAELDTHRRQAELLPDAWRAAVADVAQLLRGVRAVTAELERATAPTDVRLDDDEAVLFEAIFETWGSAFHAALARLHALSRDHDGEAIALGRRYATQLLYPLVEGCPMHRRAHDKPRGYAGDYQMMRLYFTSRHEGRTLYDRFLHFAAQRYTLGRTVIAREQVMRAAARAALRDDRRTRIVSLASGPAIELQRLLGELAPPRHPIELFLIDQDEEALAYAHQAISRVAASRGLPVELHALHFSVKQLLKPRDAGEQRITSEVLREVDLVYSAGLIDYLPRPVAVALVATVYRMLAPGGRLLVGNLRDAPDTTWMMDYVLAWHLEYRSERDMLALGAALDPGARTAVIHDATGLCMFLDAVRPYAA